MRPVKLSIFDLFQMHKQYVVPLFQRRYVWNEEKQWQPLWEDIVTKAEEVSQTVSNPYQGKKHFLGAIVTNYVQTFGTHIASAEIIDGQQRITTLQILLYALRDYAVMVGHDTSILNLVTKNTAGLGSNTESYKVWPTIGDRVDYEEIAKSGSPSQLEAVYPVTRIKYAKRYTLRPRLVEAYLFFYKCIEEYCNDALASSDNPFPALLNAVIYHLEIVAIELEAGDDPQVIFETLNARGEPLLPSDLIRNFVFLKASHQQKDVASLYKTYWSEFDDSSVQSAFWKQEQTQGRFNRPQIDLFMFHYLTSRTLDEVPIKHTYTMFRKWWDKNCPDVEFGLKELQTASQQYWKLIEPQGQSRLDVFCDRLRVLDVGPVYPILLLLTVQGKHKVAVGELPGILTDLESYLVRRLVCGFSTKNYNNLFVQVLQKLGDATTIDRGLLRNILTGFTGESGEWPTDQKFKDAWLSKPLYGKLSAQKIILILKALDLQLTTSKQEQIHLSGSLSVEHILPQKPASGVYPYYSNGVINSAPSTAQIEERELIIHTIGNLTLLTEALNSSVSNSAFSNKKPIIVSQSATRLNVYFQTLNPADVWAEETIQARGQKLFGTAMDIWPRP